MQFKNTEDTIVALATPPGIGAISVIRLSGTEAINLCSQVFKGKDLTKVESHTIHFGKILNDKKVVDEVLVSVFISPKSYTGENTVELSCHGSTYIQQKIIELLINKGARIAEPGEFTLRAFLNGKFDLAQAEAVADLIASDSEGSHSLALDQMKGVFSSKIRDLREQLIHFASMIELELDFGEEDVEFAKRDDLIKLVNEVLTLVTGLLNSFKLGNVIKNGIPVAIVGKPNVGKSTLLNALLQDDRAIVSEIAGTTRDTIEDVVNIEGVMFRFIDTAGLRDTEDEIEKIGVSKAFENIDKAEIVIYLFDIENVDSKSIDRELEELNLKEQQLIVVGNKSDRVDEKFISEKYNSQTNLLFVSAKDGTNISKITDQLKQYHNLGNIGKESAIVSNVRHFEALQNTEASLNDVLKGIENEVTGDLLAIDIKRALNFLAEITGDISTDDLLENIFSRFCIGK